MIELVIGGARSGKSRYAEQQAHAYCSDQVVYLATAQALDEEMRMRIAQHKLARPCAWLTIETPIELTDSLCRIPDNTACVVVDCLTLWLSNCILADADTLSTQRDALLNWLARSPEYHLIVVANEVGLGIVPDNALSRRFRDEAGRLNQQIAALADKVVWCVAGLPQVLKACAD